MTKSEANDRKKNTTATRMHVYVYTFLSVRSRVYFIYAKTEKIKLTSGQHSNLTFTALGNAR